MYSLKLSFLLWYHSVGLQTFKQLKIRDGPTEEESAQIYECESGILLYSDDVRVHGTPWGCCTVTVAEPDRQRGELQQSAAAVPHSRG